MSSLRSKLGPLEIAEVVKVQTKKSFIKIPNSQIFKLHKCYIPQKERCKGYELLVLRLADEVAEALFVTYDLWK